MNGLELGVWMVGICTLTGLAVVRDPKYLRYIAVRLLARADAVEKKKLEYTSKLTHYQELHKNEMGKIRTQLVSN